MNSPATCDPIDVAVLIVAYNGQDDLIDCLRSLWVAETPGIRQRIYVVDNASSDGTASRVRREFSQVVLWESPHNLGFAGGNAWGWKHIAECNPRPRYLALLNQDTVVDRDWLAPLVCVLNTQPQVAAVQPKIQLHSSTKLLHTVGNRCHYLGFGLVTGYREVDVGQFDMVREITTPSGAAVLLRTDVLTQIGLFDPWLFMYLEDVELGWNIRLAGLQSWLAADSRVEHRQRGSAVLRSYYWLERNRWLLLLTHYRVPTLVLLLPALLAMELGQWLFALTNGVLGQRWRMYGFFLRPSTWRQLRARRRAAQASRKVGDATLMRDFVARFDSPDLQSWLVRYVANPLLTMYWAIVRPLIRW